MVFTDDLAFELYTVAFAGFLIIYMTVKMSLAQRKGEKDLSGYLGAGIIPITVLGLFMFIMGLFGESTWPLPGSYNILFFDPYTLFGIIILGASLSIILKKKLQYVGFLSLMAGLVLIDYAIQGYALGLTSAPLALLGLFAFAGISGILAYPVTLIIDCSKPQKNNRSSLWLMVLVLFWIFIFLTSALAAFIAYEAIPAHLKSAP